MGAQTAELSGPDFSQGVDATLVPENGMLLGHSQGEAVILIRQAATLYALSANCPHYGAPLVDGQVVGNEIRCPWHHAAFDIASGEVTKAPAFHALKCWQVEERDGQVFIQRPRADRPKAEGPAESVHIVIIGAGAAGNAAAEALRREHFTGRITMLGAEQDLPYDKPNLSKDFLAGTAPEEWIPLRPTTFYQNEKIDVRLGTVVNAIDAANKTVKTSDGQAWNYDKCLIATGASPVKLNIPGHDRDHVFYLRSLADCKRIIAKAQHAKRIVIVGSGFIGLEAAASLRARGLDVTVITRDALPLDRVVGGKIGKFLQSLHEEQGVKFRLAATITAIEEDGVQLAGGEKICADLIIVGIGVRPDLGLAEGLGLEEASGGIKVNELLATNVADIYAAGDIASWFDQRSQQNVRVEHWAFAQRMGKAAALSLLGHKNRFNPVPFFWTQQYDATFAYVGHAAKWDSIEFRGDLAKRDAMAAFISHGLILAVLTMGRDQTSLRAEEAMERNDQITLRKVLGL